MTLPRSSSAARAAPEIEEAIFARAAWRLIPFLFLCYVVAFLDRVNVGFAKLQMAPDLGFSDAVYGFGAGIFFIGYFVFEVPSNLILQRVGARIWIARIMITWGLLSAGCMFTTGERTFYTLRFLLGVAEAGFFPGIILYLTYWFPGSRRARVVALFMTSVAISNVIGSPISGAIMQYMDGVNGWRGWQWLFLMEGLPSVIVGALVFAVLPDGPRSAGWLTPEERELIVRRVEDDERQKPPARAGHGLADAFREPRVWALAVVYFCGVVCLYAVNFWMPTIVREMGLGDQEYLRIGLLNAVPWSVAAVAMVAWGQRSDRTGERRWHCAGGLLLTSAGLFALAMVGHAAVAAMVALTLATVGLLSSLATFWSLPTAFLSGSAAAAGIAWINSVGNLGGHVGPDLIGRVRTLSGGSAEAAFFALAALALTGALIVLALPARDRAALHR